MAANKTTPADGAGDPVGWFDLPKFDNFTDILTVCCSGAVILGGLVPYIPQYLKIKKLGTSDGFSTYGRLYSLSPVPLNI